VHPGLLYKALAAVAPEITLEQFQAASGMTSRSVAKSVLEFLAANGIGTFSQNVATFRSSDRLGAASLALQMGCDVQDVSRHLAWKDFEGLASEVLGSLGYETQTNFRLTKPRMEIDVVGVNSGFGIAVDCKHWKRSNLSSISVHSSKQAARVERLVKHDRKIRQAVPAILTLQAESVKFFGGVPIVPITQFRSFIMDVKGYLHEICVIC
jgi:hypothetical protein